MEDKESKIIELSTRIESLLTLVDMFANEVENDIDLLEETKKALQDKISHNESALPIIIALGGDYDSTEDILKLKTLDYLILLVKARIEYKNEKIKQNEEQTNKTMLLNKLFGL